MTELIILGCGSSVGSPWITNYWGNCDKKNKLNLRTRCSALIKKNNLNILIDTSPDIKKQLLDNKIDNVDYVLYTHEHADQTNGIFELRPFFWKNKNKIDVYASKKALNEIKRKHDYCFFGGNGYLPIVKGNNVKKKITLKKKNDILKINTFQVKHGPVECTAYVFDKTAYISDCNEIYSKDYNKLKGLKYLVIDCLKFNHHPSHFNLSNALTVSKLINPKKTILTNLHTDLDYRYLRKNLPSNIIPAHDGMRLKI